jgi:ketosteroid isomerase-like protein
MSRYDHWAGGLYSGSADVLAAAMEWMQTWSSYTLRADELIPIGDQVLVHTWHTGWVPGNDERVREEWAMLYTLRDGKVVRIDGFSDRAEARALAESR